MVKEANDEVMILKRTLGAKPKIGSVNSPGQSLFHTTKRLSHKL